MKAIVDIINAVVAQFKALIDGVVAAFDFAVKFFGDLVYVVGLTGDALLTVPELLKWLPAAVSAVVVTILTLAVLYKILGREG